MAVEQTNEVQQKIVLIKEAMGTSGTEIYSGEICEEYLQGLTGRLRAETFDKMRRGDARVKMCLNAVKNPIKGAKWEWKISDKNPNADKILALVKREFKNELDWTKLLNEFLTVVDFGFSVFEKVHQKKTAPGFGSYIGFKKLGWRSPKTIERWNMVDGELATITQRVFGDLQSYVNIDAKNVILINLEMEGDNFEGMSMLRSAYGPWKRKDVYLKLNAIGTEKGAVPFPVAQIPTGKESGPQFEKLLQTLRNFTSNQSNYLAIPEGWPVEFHSNKYDPDKTIKSIDLENQEITFAFLANFLLLGSGGGGGSYALSTDLSDFFLSGVCHIANEIKARVTKLGRELVDLNFGPQEFYPEMIVSGIEDKIGQEFGVLLKALREGDYITPDDLLEDTLRERLNLPARDLDSSREKSSPSPLNQPQLKDPKLIQLNEKKASKVERQILNGRDEVLLVLQDELKIIGEGLIDQIVKKYKETQDSKRYEITKQVAPKGISKYQSKLKDALGSLAGKAYGQARTEAPANEALNLKEDEDENLPSDLKRLLASQSLLLASTSIQDIEKAIYFQFESSVDSTNDIEIMRKDMNESLDSVVLGSSIVTAAKNMAAKVVNNSRNSYFFSPKVLGGIESFTFTNTSPSSSICKDLNGRTFLATDPEAKRYYPPLHHNCDSFLVPNLSGRKANPEISDIGLKPSDPKLEKLITLKE